MKKDIIKKYIKYTILFILVLIGFYIFDIGCLFRKVFGICCPTCGMTRAILEIFKGNINGYVQYNAFSLPVIISLLIILYQKVFEIKTNKVTLICYWIFILNFVYYLIRFYLHLLPC